MKKKKTSVLALASRTRCDDAGSEAENQHLINVMVQAGQSIRRAVSGFGAVRGWARARGWPPRRVRRAMHCCERAHWRATDADARGRARPSNQLQARSFR